MGVGSVGENNDFSLVDVWSLDMNSKRYPETRMDMCVRNSASFTCEIQLHDTHAFP